MLLKEEEVDLLKNADPPKELTYEQLKYIDSQLMSPCTTRNRIKEFLESQRSSTGRIPDC